jgi:capsid portal protein
MLNGEATVFRRNYYINGSHAGVSGLASDCCLQQCVRVEAHHVDPQPVV